MYFIWSYSIILLELTSLAVFNMSLDTCQNFISKISCDLQCAITLALISWLSSLIFGWLYITNQSRFDLWSDHLFCVKTKRWPHWGLNPGPTGYIPDALPTKLSGLTGFNTNVINVTMASVLPPDHCYQGTGVDSIQLIAMGDIPILY